jgi:DNA-binding PadR family transcriptional regulator
MNDLIILASLLVGPTYGYAIKKTAGMSRGMREMHPNVVYPLLRKFVECGWVSQTSAPGERGQERKQYSLTNSGRAELVRRLEDFDESAARDSGEFLIRASLFNLMAPQSRVRVLELRRRHVEESRQQLLALRTERKPTGFTAAVLDFTASRMQHELRWLKQLEKHVQSKKQSASRRK